MFLCRVRRKEQVLPVVLVTCVFFSVPLSNPAWAIINLWGRTASLYRDRGHVYCRRPWLVMICRGLAVSACCFRLTRFGPAQDKFGHLASMRILQEVTCCWNGIEAGLHLACPFSAPRLIKDIISTTPYKVNGLFTIE